MSGRTRLLRVMDKAVLGYFAVYLPVFLVLSVWRPSSPEHLELLGRGIGLVVAASTLWWVCGLYCGLGLLFRGEFRDGVVAKAAGFLERDEREEIVVGRAARATFLVVLAGFLFAGLWTMVGVGFYTAGDYRGEGHAFGKPGRAYDPRSRADLKKALDVEAQRRQTKPSGRGFQFAMWPVLCLPGLESYPGDEFRWTQFGGREYMMVRGQIFPPEVPLTFFAFAALLVLTFQLFAHRYRSGRRSAA